MIFPRKNKAPKGLKKEHKPVGKTKQVKVSNWKVWLFRILLATATPLILFGCVEIVLRVINFGYPAHAIVKCEIDGREAYRNNIKFGWRFFPRRISRASHGFIFPKHKSNKTYRIFISGGSAAYGSPDALYGFGQILKVLLEQQYPDIDFEVNNTSMVAINSHVVLPIVRDCARYKPDLFIIYLGNNEVVGPYGAGTVFAPISPSLLVIRASIAVKATRIGQALESLLAKSLDNEKTPKTWGGMGMFLANQIRFDSPALKHVYHHFEQNLKDICKAGSKAGANVILCTVATNLKDCAPFASLHRPDLTQSERSKWNELFQKGIDSESSGEYAEAIKYYSSAIEIDDRFAELHFRLGRMLWRTDEYAKAKQCYIRARDLDTLRFRADSAINKIIRKVAASDKVKRTYLVDSVAALEKDSPHQTIGKEMFWEHAHMNFRGNYAIACEILGKVENILSAKGYAKAKEAGSPLSEQECARRLCYTGWARYNLTNYVLENFINRPPFTSQLYHSEQVQELESEIESLKKYTEPSALADIQNEYEEAIKCSPSSWDLHQKYGVFLKKALKDYPKAAEQFQATIKLFPSDYAYSELGKLSMQENPDVAIECFHKYLELQPDSATAHFNLAMVFDAKKQDQESAITHYTKALELDPMCSETAYRNLAVALLRRSGPDKASRVLQNGIRIFPNSANLHFYFGVILKHQGKIGEAVKEFKETLRIQPRHRLAQEALKELTMSPVRN